MNDVATNGDAHLALNAVIACKDERVIAAANRMLELYFERKVRAERALLVNETVASAARIAREKQP